ENAWPEAVPEVTMEATADRDLALQPAQLSARFDVSALPATTAEVPPLEQIHGQERAREAVAFGLSLSARGYNIAVSGAPASARTALVRSLAREAAAGRPLPPDWVYLFNFSEPHRPRALQLAAGTARTFQRALATIMEECRQEL